MLAIYSKWNICYYFLPFLHRALLRFRYLYIIHFRITNCWLWSFQMKVNPESTPNARNHLTCCFKFVIVIVRDCDSLSDWISSGVYEDTSCNVLKIKRMIYVLYENDILFYVEYTISIKLYEHAATSFKR